MNLGPLLGLSASLADLVQSLFTLKGLILVQRLSVMALKAKRNVSGWSKMSEKALGYIIHVNNEAVHIV